MGRSLCLTRIGTITMIKLAVSLAFSFRVISVFGRITVWVTRRGTHAFTANLFGVTVALFGLFGIRPFATLVTFFLPLGLNLLGILSRREVTERIRWTLQMLFQKFSRHFRTVV